MKIVSSDVERLVIESRPWFLWLILFGLGAMAVVSALTGRVDGTFETVLVFLLGLGALWVGWRFEPFQRFEFDRATDTFTHTLTRLNGSEVWTRPLSGIERAAEEGSWSDGARSQRVTLLTKDGRYPLESGFTGFARQPLIDAINQWLDANA